MAIWVHLILLPLLYLADGKPKPPGGALNKNVTDVTEDSSNLEDSEIYHFDYNLFKNKSSSKHPKRTARRLLRGDNVILDQIEIKFDWSKIHTNVHVGALFQLKDENKFLENAILYPPNDQSLTVRGLKDGSSYTGEVRIIRDKEALEDLNKTKEEDIFPFRLESPRIIPESDLHGILDAVAHLPKSKINLTSISINFKLPTLKENTVLEISDVNDINDSSKVVVHVTPKTISLVVNEIPSSAILRVILRTGENVTHKALVFTGAITRPSELPHPFAKIFFPFGTGERERLTVKCFVKDKPPFQGFPCKGSNICIPLHWECDGEEDCVGGFDESRCVRKPKPGRPVTEPSHKCKRDEFPCVSKTVPVCLPRSWLCDGRTDCSDGWDEKEANCPRSPDIGHSKGSCDKKHFECRRGGCVTTQRVCDGYNDCSDGSDEADCPEDEDEDDEEDDEDDVYCDSRFEFTCDKRREGKKCIPKPWVCDDQDDCPFGEDEEDEICRSHYHNFFDRKIKDNSS